MSNLCNATQFLMQCHICDPDRMQVPAWLSNGCVARSEQLGAAQLLGFAASIAALLTIWPISLACCASDRI